MLAGDSLGGGAQHTEARHAQSASFQLVSASISTRPPFARSCGKARLLDSLVLPAEELLEALEEEGYITPTEVQAQSWPCALAGRDLIGIADTGSGKTLAYAIPALLHAKKHLDSENDREGQPSTGGRAPSVLVLVPTRELALQVEKAIDPFCYAMDLSQVCMDSSLYVIPDCMSLETLWFFVASSGPCIAVAGVAQTQCFACACRFLRRPVNCGVCCCSCRCTAVRRSRTKCERTVLGLIFL